MRRTGGFGQPSALPLEPEARERVREKLEARARGKLPDSALGALCASSARGVAFAAAKHWWLVRSALDSEAPGKTATQVAPRALAGLAGAVALHGVGKLLSAGQTLLGVEPRGRPLSDEERALLERVFGEALDLEPLRIKEGRAGLASLTDRPFVHGEVLYLQEWTLEPHILVHEAVHWWQSQHGGPDYMLDSLCSQAFGHGYDWQASVPDVPWAELEVEQQAAFIEALYRRGYFDGALIAGRRLRTYAADAVAELRAGRGAP